MKKIIYIFLFIPFLAESGITGCSSSDKDLNQDKSTVKVSKQTPPKVNSADVEAEIMSYEEKDGYTNSNIKILRVKSYGSSVPPLPAGKIIKAEVTGSSIKNSNLSKEELLKTGSKHNIILEHFVVPSNLSSPSWKIISIE
jgi:hypothetical protein